MELLLSFSFFSILKESFKLVPKNGKVMAFIAISSILVHLSFTTLFFHSLEYLTNDMIANYMRIPQSDPATFMNQTSLNPQPLNPNIRRDAALILAVEIAFILAISVVVFLSGISTIIVSAASYDGKPFSVKDLFSCIWRTWKRVFITSFYMSLYIFGFFFIFGMLLSPLVVYGTRATLAIAAVFGIFCFGLYLYMFIPWALAIVISVVEENSSGIHAMGKAGVLVKGKRLDGFFLNLTYVVFLMMIGQGSKMALANKWLNNHEMVSGLLFAILMYSAKFLVIVAYTVLYFQCKKIHGEEVELQTTVLYTKLPTTVVQVGSDT